MIEPTTAMAEIAFVSDISGVCRSRETRRITPMPMNVASMKTKSIATRSIDESVAGVAAVVAECSRTLLIRSSPGSRSAAVQLHCAAGRGVQNLAAMRNDGPAHDLVVEI